jgi:hypothetical protein
VTQVSSGRLAPDTSLSAASSLRPMTSWVAYAKRAGLLNDEGIAPEPMKAQTAFFAYSAAWNEAVRACRAAMTAESEAASEAKGTK